MALALDVGRVRDGDVSLALLGSDAPRGELVSRPRSSSAERPEASDGLWEGGGSTPSEAIGSVAQQQSVRRNEPEGTRGGTSRIREPSLYAITRADLSVGLRAAQVGHALIAWALKHGEPCENLVVLQVASRFALEELLRRLHGRVELFHEPDLGGQLTAIAAGPENWREVSSVGLMR